VPWTRLPGAGQGLPRDIPGLDPSTTRPVDLGEHFLYGYSRRPADGPRARARHRRLRLWRRAGGRSLIGTSKVGGPRTTSRVGSGKPHVVGTRHLASILPSKIDESSEHAIQPEPTGEAGACPSCDHSRAPGNLATGEPINPWSGTSKRRGSQSTEPECATLRLGKHLPGARMIQGRRMMCTWRTNHALPPRYRAPQWVS
jgi:hypothetical protein